jgi:general secretion pathway protein G
VPAARPDRRGFTLIEVVVVLAILGILVGTVAPVWAMQVTRDKVYETRLEMQQLVAAYNAYFADTGKLPASPDNLVTNGANALGWYGPYLEPNVGRRAATQTSLSKDAWNNAYVLTLSGNQMTIRSKGPDAISGNTDDVVETIDCTPMRRAVTVDSLKVLNTAITAYNAKWLATDPLVPPLASILSKLNAKGFLPTPYTRYLTDGWASAYVESPSGATPVVKVVSTHLGLGF